MRRTLFGSTLLALAVLGFSAFPAVAEQVYPHIAVHFAPKPAGDPDGIDTHLVNFFGKAKKTLHAAFFELREQKFTDALIAAKKRGVDTKLLVDNTNFYFRNEDKTLDKRKHNSFIQQLLDAGIEVHQDNDRSALMHNKFIVLDGQYAWSGSVNPTDTFATNANNAVEMESPKMAEIYEREFDKKFTRQLFGKKAPSYAEQQKAEIDGVPMQVLFAPEDDPMSQILVQLNEAKKSVHFMQFAFTDKQCTAILLTKFKAGVDVGGIFDHRLYRSTGPYGDFSMLTRAGVPVQLYNGAGLFHHKVFIIDAGTPQAVVITGSENSSHNGNNANDENVLFIHDQKIADAYEAEYHRQLQQTSQVAAEAMVDDAPVAGSTIPRGKVVITANGVADVKRIKVEYPARWPVDPKDTSKISVWRQGDDMTKTCGMQLYAKGFYINNPGLAPSGADSVLEIHFVDAKVPAIPGVYNLYVSVSQASAPDDFKPVRQQPTITVKPAGGAAATASVASAAEDAGGALPATDTARDSKPRVAEPGEKFDALKADIADEASNDQLGTAQKYVEYLEAEAKKGTGGQATPKSREIRRILRSIGKHSPAYSQAQDLLERLEAATGGSEEK